MCHEHHSEGYENITEDVSIVKPDIDNSTKVRAMLDVLLEVIHKKETKKLGVILDLSREMGC